MSDKPTKMPVGVLISKIWGEAQKLYEDSSYQLCLLKGKAGGQSSIHYHQYKVNDFFVISGKMKIHQKRPSGKWESTIIGPNQLTQVDNEIWHRMEFLENTVALEWYYLPEISEDIVRDQNNLGNMKG